MYILDLFFSLYVSFGVVYFFRPPYLAFLMKIDITEQNILFNKVLGKMTFLQKKNQKSIVIDD